MRTGGASDGTTPLSWKIATTGTCTYSAPFECPLIAIWNDVGARSTNSCDAAQWALDLHRAGRIWLSPREIDFLASCTAWQGGLTAKMAEWLRGILDRAVAATGCVPPS